MTINILLLGFGTVGKSVFEEIQTRQKALEQVLGDRAQVIGILVKDINKQRPEHGAADITNNFNTLLGLGRIDLVIEAIGGISPAKEYIETFLQKGIPVVTANKALMARYGSSLEQLAAKQGTALEYDASVGGGIPVIRLLKDTLQTLPIVKTEAILNGTSNYILTQMSQNKVTYQESLSEAQRQGYAEADPHNDVSGLDTLNKLLILSQVIYGRQPKKENIYCEGIEAVSGDEIRLAEENNKKIKMVGALKIQRSGEITVEVRPRKIDNSHVFYNIDGVNNALSFYSPVLNTLTFTGEGAGGKPTAQAIISDVIACAQQVKRIKNPDKKRLHFSSR